MVIHFCASLPCAARQRLGDGRLMELRMAHHQRSLRQVSTPQQAAAWAELAHGCRRCPFHLGLRDFGCGGVIEHPISAAAERWLLQRLPDDLGSPAGRRLLASLQRRQADGAAVDCLRPLHRHYQLRRPLRRRWGGLLQGRIVISSSQILQLALAGGSLLPLQARLLATALGYLDERHAPRVDAGMACSPQDDASVMALKHFASMAAAAAHRDAGVFITQ